MLDYIEETYYSVRNDILNRIIQFCIEHCALYSTTLYSVARHTHKYQLDFIYEQLEKKIGG